MRLKGWTATHLAVSGGSSRYGTCTTTSFAGVPSPVSFLARTGT